LPPLGASPRHLHPSRHQHLSPAAQRRALHGLRGGDGRGSILVENGVAAPTSQHGRGGASAPRPRLATAVTEDAREYPDRPVWLAALPAQVRSARSPQSGISSSATHTCPADRAHGRTGPHAGRTRAGTQARLAHREARLSTKQSGLRTGSAAAQWWRHAVPPAGTEDVQLELIETRTFGSRVIYERYRSNGADPD
jgi:hypothetical protein